MCGRYIFGGVESFFERYGVRDVGFLLQPSFNVAPTQEFPVIVRDEDGERQAVLMRWGLVPSWAKEAGAGMINARAETVVDKPTFKRAFRNRRCLVPATGFYEWQTMAGGKQPWHFRLADGSTFSFAGLFDVWRNPNGGELWSYTILTTTANSLVSQVHRRMPVILPRAEEGRWLDPPGGDVDGLQDLLVPYPAEEMEANPVSAEVNRAGSDGERLIQPVRQDTLW